MKKTVKVTSLIIILVMLTALVSSIAAPVYAIGTEIKAESTETVEVVYTEEITECAEEAAEKAEKIETVETTETEESTQTAEITETVETIVESKETKSEETKAIESTAETETVEETEIIETAETAETTETVEITEKAETSEEESEEDGTVEEVETTDGTEITEETETTATEPMLAETGISDKYKSMVTENDNGNALIGRIVIPDLDIDVGLYYVTDLRMLQKIVDGIDTAAIFAWTDKSTMIADHSHQGFGHLRTIENGDNPCAFIITEDSIDTFECVRVIRDGWNDGTSLATNDHKAIHANDNQIIVYTCNSDGTDTITITVWEKVA